MVIFGGFERGVWKNSIIQYHFDNNLWEKIEYKSEEAPIPRAGHSAVIYDNKMYIFGGKDEDNEKLKDLWSFDFTNH